MIKTTGFDSSFKVDTISLSLPFNSRFLLGFNKFVCCQCLIGNNFTIY